ncbi:hypothetical protein SUGI_0492610 [Cryptomeria japonica]|uniref:cytochrome P450 716B2 n=1 Tax=Cryptomeria japonica TaxID=3369 RepID=UPI002408DFB1|nr:cytochrome P450 716B2 [Cryptomeria japonica]GLJ25730.1 hypothetical protein SUGI_0492610 [Cryptomeria japonica]
MEFCLAQAIARNLNDLQSTNSSFFLLLSTSLASLLLVLLILRSVYGGKGKNLPPGSLGFPLIGETLQFLSAYKSNKGKDWVKQRVERYGPVFKTSLMGSPTVILTGQGGNRFLFHNDGHTIMNTQPKHLKRIFGENGIGMLSGEEHKRIRGAIMQFMKPEALQRFVGRLDSVVQRHFADFWEGKESITVMPLMNKLTFQVACDLFFSLNDSGERDKLALEFGNAVKGIWFTPLDLPGTTYRRAFEARSRVKKQISVLVEERRREIEGGKESETQDLMSCLLSMRDENGKALSDEEIIDNVITVMIAGHDTTASLLTHLVRVMALHPEVYQNILQEQTMVLEGKQSDEPLKWEDLRNMKYTWKVAQEALRLFPPIFGGFRKAIEDVEYQGYTIPKGWQLFWETSSTHWNDENFKEPHLFDPSHFDNQVSRFVFTPFGGGPRICPGYNFAKMETMIFVHYLVTKWKWSMKNPDERIISDPAPIPILGLPINIYTKVK